MKKLAVVISLAALSLGLPTYAFSQSPFYEGKTINVVYGGGPGGTVDLRFRDGFGPPETHTGKTYPDHRIHAGRGIAEGGQPSLPGAAGWAHHGRDAIELRAGGRAWFDRGSLRYRQAHLSWLSDQRRALHFFEPQGSRVEQYRQAPERVRRTDRRSVSGA